MQYKYHIITFGCQMNISDSERTAGVFEKIGMTTTSDINDADIVVINACSVRQKAIDRIWGKLKELDAVRLKRPHRPLYTALTGCVLPADRPKFSARFDVYFPMKELPKLPEKIADMLQKENAGALKPKTKHTKKAQQLSIDELKKDKQINYSNILKEHINTEKIQVLKTNALNEQQTKVFASNPLTPISQIPGNEQHYLQVQPKYSNTFSAFVPVMTGCNAFCTYCAVPYTRGREVSRKPEEIIAEVEQLIAKGYKEISLLGQIVNKYMINADASLIKFIDWVLTKHESSLENVPELQDIYLQKNKLFKFHHLLAVINELKGNFWLRFVSSHPKWFSNELIATVARCKKVPPHIHLPVQAGADSTLKRMLRPYTIAEYKQIIKKIRVSIPYVAITTDCIVGFCGETNDEFEQTKQLFEWVQYDMAYIAQYSPRPGTKAAEHLNDDVPQTTKKQREIDLNTILEQSVRQNNQAYIGKKVRVLIDSQHKDGDNHLYLGRTSTNKKVHITTPKHPPENISIGDFITVTITAAKNWGLNAEYK